MRDRAVPPRHRAAGRAGCFVAALAVCALALFPGPASAQQIPPPEVGPVLTRATFANQQLTLRDANTNGLLIGSRGIPILTGFDPAIRTEITFQEQPTGGDLIFNFYNTGPTVLPLGCLSLGVITIGETINYMDLREGIEPVTVNAWTYHGWAEEYPTYLYSPAFVLSAPSYVIGISLQYPILDAKHNVKLNLDNPGGSFIPGEGGRGWSARFSLSTTGPETWQTVQYPATLKPGEHRRYVMSIRVTRKVDEWVRTLLPYRNFFRSFYGGVTYQREDTPVWAVLASDPAHCEASNPLGWNGPWRPDLNGWSSMAKLVREKTGGWGGTMIWLPSGSYWQNKQNNFPCTPASTWLWDSKLSTIFDPVKGMPSVKTTGRGLGFWWGRSCQTSPVWDPAVLEDFDPDNPVHAARALNELDLMVQAGATWVGLDSFGPEHTPFWKQHKWMLTMRTRYPQLKFITEPTNCDIMHTLAANFISGWEMNKVPQTQEDYYLLKHPNYLADFLVPGHEYWGSFDYHRYAQFFGGPPDINRVIADMRRYASYGYRPVFPVESMWWGLAIPPDSVRSAKTYSSADFNRDGFIDALDISAFYNQFEAADPSADVNGDGFVDPLDFNRFINDFERGW